ncbi:MAG: hypothetical protein AAF865_17980 [Pseudomonadota bacterium]
MGPVAALSRTLRNTFQWSVPATRAEFWWSTIILIAFGELLRLHLSLFPPPDGSFIAVELVFLTLSIPLIAVGTRRLVDAGVWRWFFLALYVFTVVGKVILHIPVPSPEALEHLTLQFDDATVVASEMGYFPVLRILHDVLPPMQWGLASICFLLALLPSRDAGGATKSPEVVT